MRRPSPRLRRDRPQRDLRLRQRRDRAQQEQAQAQEHEHEQERAYAVRGSVDGSPADTPTLRTLVRQAWRAAFGESGVDGSRWTWDVRGVDPRRGTGALVVRVAGAGRRARKRRRAAVEPARGDGSDLDSDLDSDVPDEHRRRELHRALAALALAGRYDGKPCRVWVAAEPALIAA